MGLTQSLSISLVSQDITNNKSTVKIKLTSTQNATTYNNNQKTGYYWISTNGGSETQYTFTTTLPKGSTVTCFETNYTFSHKADGTGSIKVRTSLATGVSDGTVTTSQSYTPPTIARATTPTLSASTVEMGKSITVNLPRASDSFTHNVTYTFGSASGTIATGATTSATFTPPLTLANQIPNATSGTGTISVQTLNGSSVIGTKTVTFTATVPSSVVPSISAVALSDPNGYASTYSGYVKEKSALKIQVTSTGSYSSTISKTEITDNSKTYTSNPATTGTITASAGSKTVSVKVTDSRGRTATKTATYTVLDYTAPIITTLTAVRCSSDGTEVDDGEYMKITYAASITSLNSKNSKQFTLKYKKSADTTWTTALSYNSGYSVNSSTVVAADTESSYDISMTVQDAFTGYTRSTDVSTAFTLIDFGKSGKGVAIGKVSERDAFEVAEETYLEDKIHIIGDYYGVQIKNKGAVLEIRLTNKNAQYDDADSGTRPIYIDLTSGRITVSKGLNVGMVNESYQMSVASFISQDWVRTKGSTGWYSEDYGGGWRMTDTTWIRTYGSKAVYIDNKLRVDNGLQVGGSCTTLKDMLFGTTVLSGVSGTAELLLSLETIQKYMTLSTYGYLQSNTALFASNADGAACAAHITGCTASNSASDGVGWYVTFDRTLSSAKMRINWLLLHW